MKPRGVPDPRDVRHSIGDLVEDDLQLNLGQVGAEAVVGSRAAEAQMRIGITGDVEAVRVFEHLLVEVGRRVEHDHSLTGLDENSTDRGVLQRGALLRDQRGGVSDDLVDGTGRPVPFEQFPLIGVFQEGHHAHGGCVTGGFVACDRQHHHEEPELLGGELLAVHRPGQQAGNHIIARTVPALFGELIGVSEDLGGTDTGIDLDIGLVVSRHLVAPFEELDAVFLWDADQFGDGLHG